MIGDNRTASWCFRLLVIAIIISMIFYLRNSEAEIEFVDHCKIQKLNASSAAHGVAGETFEEFKKVHERWQLTGCPAGGVKTILYWNKLWGQEKYFYFGSGDVFRGCPVPHCYATPDRNLMKNVEDYAAILIHGFEVNMKDLPPSRSDRQRYIFFSWESPVTSPINRQNFILAPNYYNWTISYRLDSDVARPYGSIRDLLTHKIIAPPRHPDSIVSWRTPTFNEAIDYEEFKIIKAKNRIAAWFVSHCDSPSKRDTLVKELKKHFEIDIYGKCGELRCDRRKSDNCYDLIESNYFFYLSFENTLCKDYVTEKLFRPMSRLIIPVVYGGANYKKFVPPHSYIDIMDFNSTSELAEYMLSLSKNPVEYASYFWWKRHYHIEDTTKSTLCDLCEKLHNDDLPKKTIDDFRKYYVDDQCYSPKNLSWMKSMYHGK